MGRVLAYTLVILISMVVAIAVGEGALRLISNGMYAERTTIQLNPYYEYKNAPNIQASRLLEDGTLNVLRTNAQGFAGKEYDYERIQGVTRIMILGDSSVEGKSVPANKLFTSILESKLNANEVRTEVIPRGASSWATENEVLYLKHEGLRYKPDIVIIAFFADDVKGNFEKKLYTLDLEGNLKENTPYRFGMWQSLQVWCRSVSELCGLLGSKVYPLIIDEENQDEIYFGIYRDLVENQMSKETNTSIKETKRIFQEFVRLSRENDFRPVLLIIPLKEQVDKESWERTITQNNLDPTNIDINKTNRIIGEIGKNIGLDVLDPTNYMIQKNAEGKIYFETDSHLNQRGNEVLADYLLSNLLR